MKEFFKDTLYSSFFPLALSSIVIHATQDEELPLDVTRILLPACRDAHVQLSYVFSACRVCL